MSDAAISRRIEPRVLRELFPRHAAKITSARFNVAFETARKWLADGVPEARRGQLADAIEHEVERIEQNVRRLREEAHTLRKGHAE